MGIKPRHSHDSWRMIIIASSHYRHHRPSVTISMRTVLRSHLHTAAWDSRIAIRIRHPYPLSASAIRIRIRIRIAIAIRIAILIRYRYPHPLSASASLSASLSASASASPSSYGSLQRPTIRF